VDQNDRVLGAIDGFYSAALGRLSWDDALDRLLDATGFAGACLYVFDRNARATAASGKPPSAPGLWHRFDPALRRRYETEAFSYDPQRRVLLDRPDIRVRYDALHISEREMDRDPYYALIEREAGFRYYIGTQSDPRNAAGCTLTVHRSRRAGHAAQAEIDTFQQLFTHIERALLVESRLGLTPEADIEDAAELLDGRPTGVVILGGDQRVLFANRSARDFASRADAFALDPDGIRALRSADDAALQRLLGDARLSSDIPNTTNGGVMRLARRSGLRDYVVVVSPLPSRAALFSHLAPSVCVMISDPEEAPSRSSSILQQVYGLTAAEARFAQQLSTGKSPEQAGAALDISLSTARTHLAAIFRKTETSRQTELARLLAALPQHLLWHEDS